MSTDCDSNSNYILAQAHVDAPGLANSIAHLNTSTTFSPLQPLHDTDVAGYLRHAHEQNLISTIEESRRETQEEFYRVLEERSRRDWEARKKRVFEELGGRLGGDGKVNGDFRKSTRTATSLLVSIGVYTFELFLTCNNESNQRQLHYPQIFKCKARCWLMTTQLPSLTKRGCGEHLIPSCIRC